MNVKRIFGIILTMLGIVGLSYAAITFVNANGNSTHVKSLITYGILGFIFFSSGISLVRTTKDEV